MLCNAPMYNTHDGRMSHDDMYHICHTDHDGLKRYNLKHIIHGIIDMIHDE